VGLTHIREGEKRSRRRRCHQSETCASEEKGGLVKKKEIRTEGAARLRTCCTIPRLWSKGKDPMVANVSEFERKGPESKSLPLGKNGELMQRGRKQGSRSAQVRGTQLDTDQLGAKRRAHDRESFSATPPGLGRRKGGEKAKISSNAVRGRPTGNSRRPQMESPETKRPGGKLELRPKRKGQSPPRLHEEKGREKIP